MLSEFEHLKAIVSKLEEENRVCHTLNSCRKTWTSLIKVQLESTTASLQDANKELAKGNELERRQIKQECYNR